PAAPELEPGTDLPELATEERLTATPAEAARAYLEQVAARLAREHPALRARIDVRVDAPVAAITAAEDDQVAGVVVMSTHGHNGPLRPRFGGVAHELLQRGESPLLLVRPDAARAESEELRR